MKPKFKKIVDAGDVISTRLFLSNEMMLDPRGNSFKEMLSYAETTLKDLYENHNNSVFDMNKQNWNEELLFSVKNDLDSNFSRERLAYYFELAKVVLKDKADSLDAEEKRAKTQIQTYNNAPSEDNTTQSTVSNKDIYKGITIGGAILTVAGLFIEKTVVACAVCSLGIVGAAVSGYLLYNESKK